MELQTEVWYLPRPATDYPGCFPLHFEKKIPELLQTKHFVHLFSGSSKIGHTVDINKKLEPKTLASAEKLPFPNNFFGGGFADPPYNKMFAKSLYNCKYPKWSLWTTELVRVVKSGGIIGIMQNYIVPKLPNCKMLKIIIILQRIKQFPKIVTLQVKEKKTQKTLF